MIPRLPKFSPDPVPSPATIPLPSRPSGVSEPSILNQRRHGRVLCEGVESSLGAVLDVSASGMRVRLRRARGWAEGQTLHVSLMVGSEIVPVEVRVVRVVRRLFRGTEVGLEFQNPSPAARDALAALAGVGHTLRAIDEIDVRVESLAA